MGYFKGDLDKYTWLDHERMAEKSFYIHKDYDKAAKEYTPWPGLPPHRKAHEHENHKATAGPSKPLPKYLIMPPLPSETPKYCDKHRREEMEEERARRERAQMRRDYEAARQAKLGKAKASAPAPPAPPTPAPLPSAPQSPFNSQRESHRREAQIFMHRQIQEAWHRGAIAGSQGTLHTANNTVRLNFALPPKPNLKEEREREKREKEEKKRLEKEAKAAAKAAKEARLKEPLPKSKLKKRQPIPYRLLFLQGAQA